jgi:hypothetical protein
VKEYAFEVNKKLPPEQWERPGKPEWAAFVRVELELDRALELAQSIIEQARSRATHGDMVELNLFGELTPKLSLLDGEAGAKEGSETDG